MKPDTVKNECVVARVAKAMNVSQQFIRIGLQNGVLPIGSAVKNPGGRWSYYISPKKLFEYTGIKLEDL
jgi:hypothetical protein